MSIKPALTYRPARSYTKSAAALLSGGRDGHPQPCFAQQNIARVMQPSCTRRPPRKKCCASQQPPFAGMSFSAATFRPWAAAPLR